MWITTKLFSVQIGRLCDRSGCPYGVSLYWDELTAEEVEGRRFVPCFKHEIRVALPVWLTPKHNYLLELSPAPEAPHEPSPLDRLTEGELTAVLERHLSHG